MPLIWRKRTATRPSSTRFYRRSSAPWQFVWALAVWLTACQSAVSQPPDPILTPEQVRQDLLFLQDILDTAHVAPWLHADKKIFVRKRQRLENQIFWPLTVSDFYASVAPLVATLNDPHTRLLPPSPPNGVRLFPLALALERGGRALVASDATAVPRVPIGAEVIAINDVPISVILTKLGRYVAAETESGRRRRLQKALPLLLHQVMQLRTPFKVTWRLGYAKQQIAVDGVSYEDFMHQRWQRKAWQTFTLAPNVYVLKGTHFDMPPEAFRKYCDTFFRKVIKTPNARVILDLRDNSGGLTENVLTLLTWLVPSKQMALPPLEIRISDVFSKWYEAKLDAIKTEKYGDYLAWLPWQFLDGWRWRLLLSDEQQYVRYNWKLPQVAHPRYRGPLVLIANGGCFSGCVTLLDQLVRLRGSPLVGEAPGELAGGQRALPIIRVLPNSRLRIEFPAARLAADKPLYSLGPTNPVMTTGADLADGLDPYYETALRLLATKVHQFADLP
ncbi:MAG: hypothetical protein D6694_00890 [Gammaproteobacteria bacterium]|nr:MAG: hypothetical protein D6694_00890 [Gammaproteobacteria bacterium]